MRVFNITCECGYDNDFEKLSSAKVEARKHKKHYDDGRVFINEVLTDMDSEGNYQTGKYIIV